QIFFEEGHYDVGKDKRYGFAIHFMYGAAEGRIDVAGLPIRDGDTAKKRERVRVQALLIVRDQLRAQVTARVLSPRSGGLVGSLRVDGKRTVTQAAYESGRLPMLMMPAVDGELVPE